MKTIQPLSRVSSEPYVAAIPGSKSYTNRALILAAQRMGTTYVDNGLISDDTVRLSKALSSFGGLEVSRLERGFRVERSLSQLKAPSEEVHLGAAGTPVRFMLSFSASAEGDTVLTGTERLCERPMGDLLNAFQMMGVNYECLNSEGHLPIRVRDGTIESRHWNVSGAISSQFSSSLLLHAAQQANGVPIRITIEGNLVSKPYVGMTVSMMGACGIEVQRVHDQEYVVTPSMPATERIPVETDASGMSYFLAAAVITGTTVEIPKIGKRSAQGDVGLAQAFADMGCRVDLGSEAIRLTGGELKGIDIDMDEMPDTVLTLAAVAAVAKGPTHIRNIANLRVKECDRIHAAATELSRLGVRVEEGQDFLVIRPEGSLQPAQIHTYDDHRVAMSFSVLGLLQEGIAIEDPDCVTKSFPDYWQEFSRFVDFHQAGNHELAGAKQSADQRDH